MGARKSQIKRGLNGNKRVIPPNPLPTGNDGVLRQKDFILPPWKKGYSYIYQLLDPLTGKPRYIGLTTNPKERLNNHAKSSAAGKETSVYKWWRKVLKASRGHSPVMRIIEGPIMDNALLKPAEKAEFAWETMHRLANIELANEVRCGGARCLDGGFWTIELAEETIAALVSKLCLDDNYPTCNQFLDNDLKGLYDVILKRLGGHRRLAKRLGLKMWEPWNVSKIEDTILRLVDQIGLRDIYPSRAQFEDSGLGGLYVVILRRFGGHLRIAQQLGLTKRRVGGAVYWNEENAKEKVLQLVSELNLGTTYPTVFQFRENNLTGLYVSIRSRLGGHHTFAERLGLVPKNRNEWNEENIHVELTQIIKKLRPNPNYPTANQFRTNGLGGLYNKIRQRPGGHKKMAEQFGLPMVRSR